MVSAIAKSASSFGVSNASGPDIDWDEEEEDDEEDDEEILVFDSFDS